MEMAKTCKRRVACPVRGERGGSESLHDVVDEWPAQPWVG